MAKPALTLRLREKLRPDAADDLGTTVEDSKTDMLEASQERFEARLTVVAAELRSEMGQMRAELRQEMAAGHGQVVATASILAFMLRTMVAK